ncbi:hypothetical protein D3C72_2440150 [compost metagenome]
MDKIVGSCPEGRLVKMELLSGGSHENRQIQRAEGFADDSAKLQSRHFRHHNINDAEVKIAVLRQKGKRLFAAADTGNRIVLQ